MEYYQCTKIDLHHEITRRGFHAYGDQDVAAERLKQDDDQRGSIATTVHTVMGISNSAYIWKLSPEYGKTVLPVMLNNERKSRLLLSPSISPLENNP